MSGPVPGATPEAPSGPWVASADGRYVDLQTHSTASDGILAPADVAHAAADAGLVAFALTDHDTVDGLDDASAVATARGMRFVPGIEFSAKHAGDELHLLGLHIDDRAPLERALAGFRDDRTERMREMLARLDGLGVVVPLDEVLAEAAGAPLGRPHLARVLVRRGVVPEFRTAFDRFLGYKRPAYVARREIAVADVIGLVHAAGGLAIWAHPGEMATPLRLGALAKLGLDGVEVLHPSHPQWLAERLFDRVEAAGLLPSGGSDWHGHADGVRALGGQFVPAAWLARQDARVAERRAAAGALPDGRAEGAS